MAKRVALLLDDPENRYQQLLVREARAWAGRGGVALLEEEGRSMVARGELAATVVMPPTTPPALEILKRYWDAEVRSGTALLEASSHPALDALGSP